MNHAKFIINTDKNVVVKVKSNKIREDEHYYRDEKQLEFRNEKWANYAPDIYVPIGFIS